jgi:alanine dehydrogenase
MRIGIPKEVKNAERRVGLTPESAAELTRAGHEVYIESEAGLGIDASNDAYAAVGAEVVSTAEHVFEAAELIVKVKEPQAAERAMLRPDHTLFTYLHLAPDAEQTKDLIASRATCIAYETVTDPTGGLPLLTPMSRVACSWQLSSGSLPVSEPCSSAS